MKHSNGADQESAPPLIAIVGMAMRLPGGIQTSERFWELLIKGEDVSSVVPESRYNIDAFYHPTKPQSAKTRSGYFLRDDYVGSADTSFFQMAGYEAGKLDPQQMLLMEVVWECMENAGQTGWRGQNIGCYVGAFGEDWHELSAKETQDIPRVHAFATGAFALSNRVSYEYDLKGPSVTIQTACSSSMVALHEACCAIYSGTCSSAIVAGTNIILSPTMTANMSDNMVLSPSGHCKTFDADADGYARAEAVNAVYLKPLDQAIRDGDPIRSVLRSTSTNFDGRTEKIFSPNADSQERLIRQAYERARIDDFSQTAFFECHGTGTRAGDLAEGIAVGRIFGPEGIYMGAVKPNVGHSEGASGLTSVIKAVLALEHRIIPPNIHFTNPNPKIPFKERGLRVPTEPIPWPPGRADRVSVNCFGIGGANAHAVLELPPSVRHKRPQLLVASAQSEESLRIQVSNIQDYVKSCPGPLYDVAYTLGTRREHLQYRAFMISTQDGCLEAETSRSPCCSQPPVVFTFPGQGTQWPEMCKGLVERFASFLDDIRKMDCILKRLPHAPTWSIEEELLRPRHTSRVNEPELSQPLVVAVQIAIVNLLASWGTRPTAVVGHSSGEIAAAYAAGAISVETAIIASYYRGQVVKSNKRAGAMAVVGLSKEEVYPFLVDGVVVACENSPRSVNLSGDKDRLDAVLERIQREMPETYHSIVNVGVAYHSHHMLCLGEIYENMISPYIVPQQSMTPMYSSVTEGIVPSPAFLDATYWRQNLESPVRYLGAVEALLERPGMDHVLFIEVGPHSVLSSITRQIFNDRKEVLHYIPTLLKDGDASSCVLKTAGLMYLFNHCPDFQSINGPGEVVVDIPPYPWHRTSINWKESRVSREWRFRKYPQHELLGCRMLECSDLEPSWRNILNIRNIAWLYDHRVFGEVFFPCAGYIAIVNEAMRQISGSVECTLRNVCIQTPLVLQMSTGVEIMTSFKPVRLTTTVESMWYEFTIASYDGKSWTKHCVGKARPGTDEPEESKIIKPLPRSVSIDTCYQAFQAIGLQYGPRFRKLRRITADPMSSIASATVCNKPVLHECTYTVHPTTIDQCLQLFSVAGCRGRGREAKKLYLPAFIERVYIGQGGPMLQVEASISSPVTNHGLGDATAVFEDKVVVSLRGALMIPVAGMKPSEESGVPLASYMEWRPEISLSLPLKFSRKEPEMESRIRILEKLSNLSLLQILKVAGSTSPSVPHLQKYPELLRRATAAVKALGRGDISTDPVHVTREKLFESLHHDDQLRSYAELNQNVVNHCTDILNGSVDSLTVLGQEGGLHTLYETFYYNNELCNFFTLLHHSNPMLRILEIGAGTGGSTTYILKALLSENGRRPYSQYMCTDISSSFLDRTREAFKDHKNTEFQLLDIAVEPSEQGFQSQSYDVVIASNVLGAIADLSGALQNVKSLMAPGGYLVIQEFDSMIANSLCITGLLPDWWDGNGEFYAPSVSPASWNTELHKAGLKEVVGDMPLRSTSLPATTTIVASVADQERKGGSVVILGPQDNAWAQEVACALRNSGHTVNWGTLNGQVSPTDTVISLLDLNGPFFKGMDENSLSEFKGLVGSSERILWVTKSLQITCDNPDYGLVLGVSRTIKRERGHYFGTFEIDKFDSNAVRALLRVFNKFCQQYHAKDTTDLDYEFALHEGVIHVGRFQWTSLTEKLFSDSAIGLPTKLAVSSPGSLNSLQWTPDGTMTGILGADDIEVDIHYVGLNFRDVMIALGIMGHENEFGGEASGIVKRIGSNVKHLSVGDRVCVVQPGLFQTRTVVPASNCIRLPEKLALEDGATMCIAYGTAYYSLIDIGRLKNGDSVLIHAACGGVGLAAIQICQTFGAEIYATVGSEQKVMYLVNTFGISRDRIFNSRDSSFQHDLLRMTDGRGVDLVLNSLAGELLHASWKCVAKFGKMIEIGKRDFIGRGMLSMDVFAGNRAFFGVDLLELGEKPGFISRLFGKVLELFERGQTNPIRPMKIVMPTEVEDAFREMQKGRHMGKIALKMAGDIVSFPPMKVRQQFSLSPHAAYLLVGGLGGIGRAIATWMVEKGARYLIFLSRSAGESDTDREFFRELHVQGCLAVPVKGSVAILNDVKRAVAVSPKPIGGVLQLSMIVRDQFFPALTYENWKETLSPKVQGTWNLHEVLLEETLDFFVAFSSVSGVMGHHGQISYSAANTFLNSFVQYRRLRGHPASVINLGCVDEIGYLATDNPRLREGLRAASVCLLSEQNILDALEIAITRQSFSKKAPTGQQVLISDDFTVGMNNTKHRSDPTVRQMWGKDARFRAYANFEAHTARQYNSSALDKVRETIASIEKNPEILDDPECRDRITAEMFAAVRTLSGFGKDQDDEQVMQSPIDSLLTFELRNWYRRYINLELSSVDIANAGTLGGLMPITIAALRAKYAK
ncbi:hypothetical protein BDV32DRAFT_137194 [Aspergillus pseudonomiae]|uniref:Polyketide synthase n=1 Tax=Aspergillus pseudonomiae TaxID=1506151 RepID=A0A5N6I762_9EURO|nr:uncharacterized protein BDV37DRAFT_291563 [Aspergillus pseudonomiae]KAB8261609.1 hypothetical protein BDV32DRAFT_137194 [Aspergillus pseudonomiae]KAE8406845.1 hypothetical protein BDV37DRAFT_291563 [Aspergillus pseudonomiae]